jgi:hypothetical protein
MAIQLLNELPSSKILPYFLLFNYHPLDSTDFYCQDAILLKRTHHPHSRFTFSSAATACKLHAAQHTLRAASYDVRTEHRLRCERKEAHR